MIEFFGLSEENIYDVCEIEKLSLDTPWGEKEMRKELENKNSHYICIKEDEKTVGYIGVWNIAGEGNITNVAVHPDYRRKGYGKILVEKMKDYAKTEDFYFLTLEVNENNINAYNLYKKCGFYEIGRRRKYYHNTYDAILMQYDIKKS